MNDSIVVGVEECFQEVGVTTEGYRWICMVKAIDWASEGRRVTTNAIVCVM